MSGKAIRETLGFLAVVASMVFVGLEIRQNTIASRAAAYQAIGIATATVIDNMAHDRDFLIATEGKGPSAMDTTDWRQRAKKLEALARLAETVLIQVDQGLLRPDAIERLGYAAGWEGVLDEPTEACVWPLIRPGVRAR